MFKKQIFNFSLLALLLSMGAQAQPEEYTEITTSHQRFGDWIVRCEREKGKDKECVMTQQITSQSTGMSVLQANFAKTEQGTQMTLIFPLGIFLPPGVELEVVDHIKANYSVSFCSASGCYVNQILDNEMLEFLRRKEQANITVYSSPDNPVTVPFSIKGFLDAHRKL
ncbi:MAG: invasion associated locus B family protein [Gammaproteobacteria bacterium]|nr:invasion associated locus B family protein [Gammaproteobacteria bacterium]